MRQYSDLQPHRNSGDDPLGRLKAELIEDGKGFKNHPGEPPFNQNERIVLAAFHSYQMGRIGSEALGQVMQPIPLNDMACGLDRLHVSANHGVPASEAMNRYIETMHGKIKEGDSFVPNDHLKGRVDGLKTWLQGADRGRPRMLTAQALQYDDNQQTVVPALKSIGLQEFMPKDDGSLRLDGETQAREVATKIAKPAKSPAGSKPGSSP